MISKLVGKTVSETTVRKQIKILYEEDQKFLINLIQNEKIYLIFDESPIKTFKFWNVLIGLVKNPGKEYLLGCFNTEKTSNSELLRDIINNLLDKYSLKYENLVLIISDAVKYNITFYKKLCIQYSHIMHFTCISHLLHNCVTFILKKFNNVNLLIKKINTLIGYNKRLHSLFRDLGTFKKPCETRWGTSIDFLIFLKNNFDQIVKILNEFKNDGSETYINCMNLIKNKSVFDDITYIVKNYGFLGHFIILSEKNNFSILQSIDMIKKIRFNHDKIGLKNYLFNRIKKHFLNNFIFDINQVTEN